MDPDSTIKIILLIICLILSAFFSSAETALMSINKIRLRNMLDEGKKGAENLKKLLDTKEKMLGGILVGNNLVNIAASSLTTSLAIQISPPGSEAGVAISTFVVTLAVLIFGEITPKSMAIIRAEKISLAVAKPIMVVSNFFYPLVFVLNKIPKLILKLMGQKGDSSSLTITEKELKTMVDMSHEEGVIKPEEKEMIHNVFDFGDREIKEIMTPRIYVSSAYENDSYDEIIKVFREEQFSRIPIWNTEGEEIIGILHIKDMALANKSPGEFAVKDYIRKPHFVYEFHKVSKVFKEMRKDRISIAIVLDEYGVMSGIVTIEDVIEEIVGDITDEYDEPQLNVIKTAENEYLVDGGTSIDDFDDATSLSIETEDFDSIGGYVLGLFGDLPEEGATTVSDGVEFTAEKVESNRIESLKVKRLTIEETADKI